LQGINLHLGECSPVDAAAERSLAPNYQPHPTFLVVLHSPPGECHEWACFVLAERLDRLFYD